MQCHRVRMRSPPGLRVSNIHRRDVLDTKPESSAMVPSLINLRSICIKAQETAQAHHYHNPLTLVRSDPRAVSALHFSSLCHVLGILAVSRRGLAWVVGQEPLHVSALRNHGHLHGPAISTPRIASIAPLMLFSENGSVYT